MTEPWFQLSPTLIHKAKELVNFPCTVTLSSGEKGERERRLLVFPPYFFVIQLPLNQILTSLFPGTEEVGYILLERGWSYFPLYTPNYPINFETLPQLG
jgi:hypothetical protein